MTKKNRSPICDGFYREGNAICIDLSVYFTNSDAIPAIVFSDSVIGMNRMVNNSMGAMLNLLGIDSVAHHGVYLETVRNGSKFTDFVFKVFMGSEADASKTASMLHKRFGINKMLEGKQIQNILIAAIIAYCVRDVAIRFMPDEKAQPVITATSSVILNAGRDLHIDGPRFESILKEGIPNTAKAGKGAVMALQPATMKLDTTVKIGGPQGFEIPNIITNNLPDPATIDTKDKPITVDFDDVTVSIIASDIDKQKAGWAVKLPEGYPCANKRIKAILGARVSPAGIMYKEKIKVDLTLYMNSKKNPQRILIRAVKP